MSHVRDGLHTVCSVWRIGLVQWQKFSLIIVSKNGTRNKLRNATLGIQIFLDRKPKEKNKIRTKNEYKIRLQKLKLASLVILERALPPDSGVGKTLEKKVVECLSSHPFAPKIRASVFLVKF